MTETTNYNKAFEDRLGYSSKILMELFKQFSNARRPYEGLWRVLDAIDSGDFWEIVKNKVPDFYLKPNTNWINYVKTSLVNSLYTGKYRGDVFPRILNDKKLARNLNKFLEYEFDKIDIHKFVVRAGERAGLLNFGALEIGWNADIIDGINDELFQGDIEVKFIDNMSLFLDPTVVDAKKGRAIFVVEEVPIIELMNESRFRARMVEYLQLQSNNETLNSVVVPAYEPRDYGKGYYDQRERKDTDGTVRFITCYYKYQPEKDKGYRIDRIWMINEGFILDIQTDLRPKTFPIRILYAWPPVKDPYGTPVTKLILKNAITLDIINSVDATHVWASQRRPKIMSKNSGINERTFAEQGNNPDKLWVVQGDPERVVRYIDLPELPRDRHLLKEQLMTDIMRISGIDDRYTGRDTGSIQTTGGMDLLNQRISMNDNMRITQLQEFIKDVTELILSMFIEHCEDERKFPIYTKSRKIDELGSVNFKELKQREIGFDFVVNVTPHLPNNVQRRATAADLIMEKQMQYNMQPPLMTPEEWLECQDFPQKYQILERMEAERMRNDEEEVMSDIVNFAGMTQSGMRPEAAIKQLARERQFKREQPGIGSVAGGSIQAKQMG